MRKKKNIFIVILGLIIIIGVLLSLFLILNDKNKLTVQERNWINENINIVQNLNVINNTNIFGKDGSGVFYDFLNDFTQKYDLKINPITFNTGNMPQGLSFGIKNNLKDNDIVFYKDHYVLLSKKEENYHNYNDLDNKTVGILTNNLSHVSKYVKNLKFTQFDTTDALYEAFNGELEYIIVPLLETLDLILSNDYYLNYHFSDINNYYVMQINDNTLSKVLEKYYYDWIDEFETYFYNHQFNTFINSLNISETELDEMQRVVYNCGFINTSPYEIIMGGEYGGITAVYLSHFSKMSDVEFNFIKYNNYQQFYKDIQNKKIDLYFNYYNHKDKFQSIKGPLINFVVVARKNNSKVIESLNSLIGEEVYVEKNSKIYDYVSSINGINIKTYQSEKELFKLNKEKTYIILDENIFKYYEDDKLDNFTKRYEENINDNYEFKVKDNNTLFRILNKYISILDEKEIEILGIENHYETVKAGSLLGKIAEYIIVLVLILIIILLVVIRKSKKISIAKKIKKDDKLKFIDQLTSLKNRNFLNENIDIWNNNTIYPQTIVVIDLNKIQEINDLHGYNEGDRQIKSAANALVKTQLDNSEIMRTDGNEFVIYLVGYTQKQISNYIHKLNKEINRLPYNFGAEFGYSMILDDIKTIEDAMNEAVEDMKKQKGNDNEKQSKK